MYPIIHVYSQLYSYYFLLKDGVNEYLLFLTFCVLLKKLPYLFQAVFFFKKMSMLSVSEDLSHHIRLI
jgi:hypothetical protein